LGVFALVGQADSPGDIGLLLRCRVFGHDDAAAGKNSLGVSDIEGLALFLYPLTLSDFIGDRQGVRGPFDGLDGLV
jgi:hypothetical protein